MPSPKEQIRLRRKASIRKRVHGTTERPRLSVFRSAKHIYAQVIDDSTSATLVASSSLVKELASESEKTKRELAECYATVADAATIHLRERPTTMKRLVDGAGGDFFFQKRVPKGAPDWLESATVHFPSGRSARELCANDAAHLVWAVNLG